MCVPRVSKVVSFKTGTSDNMVTPVNSEVTKKKKNLPTALLNVD